jgi:hypothetical protein
MGYVIRCSKTVAYSVNGETYFEGGEKLQEVTTEGFHNLKELYAKENATDEIVEYGFVPFSMNKGDYTTPIL